MNCSMEEVLKFVQENDVKFIRLAFCDLIGVQKKYFYYALRAGACVYKRDLF